eukprot:7379969-Prymnesium_polylepis.1
MGEIGGALGGSGTADAAGVGEIAGAPGGFDTADNGVVKIGGAPGGFGTADGSAGVFAGTPGGSGTDCGCASGAATARLQLMALLGLRARLRSSASPSRLGLCGDEASSVGARLTSSDGSA